MRRYGACLLTTTLDANIGEKPCSLENKSHSSPPNAGPQRPEMGLNQRATSQLAQGGAPGLAAAWHLPSCAPATSVVAPGLPLETKSRGGPVGLPGPNPGPRAAAPRGAAAAGQRIQKDPVRGSHATRAGQGHTGGPIPSGRNTSRCAQLRSFYLPQTLAFSQRILFFAHFPARSCLCVLALFSTQQYWSWRGRCAVLWCSGGGQGKVALHPLTCSCSHLLRCRQSSRRLHRSCPLAAA